MELSNILAAFNRKELNVAALPPDVQEAREKDAILKDPRLVDILGNAAIREIRKVEGGYLVITDSLEMKVDVRYIRPETPICGPAKFELIFQPLIPNKLSALPPHVQEAREKAAIYNDPRLVDILGNAAIREIRKVEGGYLVITDSVEMKVDVRYIRPESHICGPAKFELDFHPPMKPLN